MNSTKRTISKRKVVFIFISSFIIGIIFVITMSIISNNNSSKQEAHYIQNSDYYFNGTIIECIDFAPYYHCLIIKIDTIDIKKIANSKYYAGAYNKEKGLVAFFGQFNNNLIPKYITVDSKKNSVIYDNAINPITEINTLELYNRKFTKVLRKKGGYWEWF